MSETFSVAPPHAGGRSHKSEETAPLADTLAHIARAFETAVGVDSPLVARLRALLGRLRHERLQIAVLGQFKRGKSTFINALLGAPLLPTGIVPLTAVSTFIAWGDEARVVVSFADGRPSQQFNVQTADEIRGVLFRFVAEEANPENRLDVARVDLYFPADILTDGTVIIDTPGVGSTLRHNTEAALQTLAECDAAFFVVSADPPITEVEVEFLRRVKSKAARVFFILNKVDNLRNDERRAAVDFLRKVLLEKDLLEVGETIFCVSARAGLEAKRSGDARALETSGVAALENHIVRTLAGEKRRWLEEAVRLKAADILSQALAELDLRLRVLTMPLEELSAKADAFRDALHSIEEQRRVTEHLLAGDHRRLRLALDSRVQDLRRDIAQKLERAVDASLADNPPAAWEEATHRALSAATQQAFDAAREPFAAAFGADAGAVLLACQERIETLVNRVRRTAAEIFDVPLPAEFAPAPFALASDPYWVTEEMKTTLMPDPSRLIDLLLPASLRRSRLRARMNRQAGELIVRNTENLRWAIWRGLDETFRNATAQFEERLDEAIRVTRNVIDDALARQRDRSFAMQAEVDRLTDAAASLNALHRQLGLSKS